MLCQIVKGPQFWHFTLILLLFGLAQGLWNFDCFPKWAQKNIFIGCTWSKIFIFKVPVIFWRWKLWRASGKICRFFVIDLNGSSLTIFEHKKKIVNHSTLLCRHRYTSVSYGWLAISLSVNDLLFPSAVYLKDGNRALTPSPSPTQTHPLPPWWEGQRE